VNMRDDSMETAKKYLRRFLDWQDLVVSSSSQKISE
jgi:hypothetical protein